MYWAQQYAGITTLTSGSRTLSAESDLGKDSGVPPLPAPDVCEFSPRVDKPYPRLDDAPKRESSIHTPLVESSRRKTSASPFDLMKQRDDGPKRDLLVSRTGNTGSKRRNATVLYHTNEVLSVGISCILHLRVAYLMTTRRLPPRQTLPVPRRRKCATCVPPLLADASPVRCAPPWVEPIHQRRPTGAANPLPRL